jgi:hypothetical protein
MSLLCLSKLTVMLKMLQYHLNSHPMFHHLNMVCNLPKMYWKSLVMKRKSEQNILRQSIFLIIPSVFFVSNVKLSVGDNILGGWEYVMEVFVVLLSVNIPLNAHNFKVCNVGGHGLHLCEL